MRPAVGLIVLLIVSVVSAASGQTFRVLHTFLGDGHNDGKSPFSGVVLSGSRLFGTTIFGGNTTLANGYGTVYGLNTDGSGYGVMHNFSPATTDGFSPWGGVTVSGSTLYGTTELGGSSDQGTVFAIGTSGSGFTLLHSFVGSDGADPVADPIVSGTSIYGTANGGGGTGNGTIFQLGTNGSGFSNLHSFDGASGGQNPYDKLLLSGSTLFGVTFQTGSSPSSVGLVFGSQTDGTGFTVLHSFSQYAIEGAHPVDYGGLALVGSTLYGTVSTNGSNDDGVIFSMNEDGSGFQVLHEFAGGSDGAGPTAGLTVVGNTLYGTTADGGPNNDGTIYKINPDGSGYATVYSFSGLDGANPIGALTAGNSTLYGTTSAGGSAGDGVVFSITVPEPSGFILAVSAFFFGLGRSKRMRVNHS